MTTMQDYEKLTSISKKDLVNAWMDQFGVKYSADEKRLLEAPSDLKGQYIVRPGTEVICCKAFPVTIDIALDKIVLPEGLKAIGEGSLCGCNEPIDLPSTVEYIGDNAFLSCHECFEFPKSLKYITRRGIPIEAEDYISHSPYVKVIDGMIIHNDTLLHYFGNNPHVAIPNEVVCVGEYAFTHCESLQSITIPKSVVEIGEEAFSNCVALHTVTILGYPKIGKGAFENCPRLKSNKQADESWIKGSASLSQKNN